jgi:hypothetical protein
MTKKTVLFFAILLSCFQSFSQESKVDKMAITSLIQRLFDAMHSSDSTGLSSLFTENAAIETVASKNNIPVKTQESKNGFIAAVAKKHLQTWEERTGDYHLTISGNYAVCIMDYAFYLNDSLHHCGINNFELLKSGENWKIDKITDTRQTTGCCEVPANSILERENLTHDTLSVNIFLNNWHQAAAKADELVFFDSMDENGIYIGTDATECWSRQEFYDWALKYFDRETAWDFRPVSRNIYFSKDGKTVWFNELLDTWMGVCRGSGTLHAGTNGWKIDQYHLSVTVPNEKIKDFIELLK